jgi:hypothetical protein
MPSRLANSLHAVPVTDSDIGDIIWRNTDLQNLEETKVVPSEKLIYEYSLLVQPDLAEKIATLVPTPQLCEYVYSNLGKDFLKGLVSNKYVPLSILPKINKDVAALLEDNVNKVKNKELLEHDFLSTPYYAFLELLDKENLMESFIDSIKNTIYLSGYVGFLSSVVNNKFTPQLVSGLIFDSKTTIDYATAYYISVNDTVVCDTLREEVRSIKSNRISDSAQAIFNAYQVDFAKSISNKPSSTGVSKEMLEALRLTGASDTELSALLFSNAFAEIDSDFVVQISLGTPNTTITQFLTGAYARSPKISEIDAIFTRLPQNRIDSITENLVEHDLNLPWASSLLKYLPRRSLDKLPTYSIFEIHKIIEDAIGDNLHAWDFVLFMSEEWENNFSELLKASIEIDKE